MRGREHNNGRASAEQAAAPFGASISRPRVARSEAPDQAHSGLPSGGSAFLQAFQAHFLQTSSHEAPPLLEAGKP